MYGTFLMQPAQTQLAFQTVIPLYQKAVLRGKLHGLLATLTRRSSRLQKLSDLLNGKTITTQRPAGVRVVRISDIRASEERADDFDRTFNPLETHTKSRWLSIAAARLSGVPMPAVELLKVGDVYAVRDGHHRISVAQALGEHFIDANVVLCDL